MRDRREPNRPEAAQPGQGPGEQRVVAVTDEELGVVVVERERGLGPWSAGVVCLEGLGRHERGLVGDLSLIKLMSRLRGRWVEGHETAELLQPYGEWAGLASIYLATAFTHGLMSLPAERPVRFPRPAYA